MPGSEPLRQPIVATASGAAPGLAGIWATALATLLVLAMLATLLAIVVVNAFGWFWPARIAELERADGTVLVGEQVGREAMPAAADATELLHRVQLKVGNRELTGSDFVWVPEAEILAHLIADVLDKPSDETTLRRVQGDAEALCRSFPVYAPAMVEA